MKAGDYRLWKTINDGRRWRPALAFVLAAGVAACAGEPGAAPGTTGKAGAPEAVTAEQAAPLANSTNVIYVMPVEGLESPLRLVLADAVAASLRDTERPAILADVANNQGPTIQPVLERVRERGSVVWVTTLWKLRAPYGTVVAERQREMVIDKRLWEQRSVETVNLILDDAMPAVSAMVHDFVGPLDVAEAPMGGEPPQAAMRTPAAAPPETAPGTNMPTLAKSGDIPLKSEASGQPILGRTAAEEQAAGPSETLPEGVGAPAPPEPHENLVLDLPNVTETESEQMPGPLAADGAPPPSMPAAAPAPTPAEGPPMVLAPANRQAEAVPDAMPAVQPPPAERAPMAALEAEPKALSAPPPPEAIAGIAPAPRDTPVRWGKPSFLIRTIEGAPGDGNKALQSAIMAALRAKDLTVTEDPRQAGYEVAGKVEVGPPVNGRQRARITWAVNTVGGQEVGKAVQENVVAAGSLNGSWGQVAVLVSSAAAGAIQQLFEAPRPKYTPVGAVPAFPKIPDLPRVPGRALPPPS